ncbi:hypothetical protein EMCRGX_G032538 [Ephydatia muelleri]
MSTKKNSEKKEQQRRKQQAVDAAHTKCFKRDGVDLTVTSYSVSQLPKEDLEWALELLKSNMEALYVTAGWGWDGKKKRRQLCHESSLFLIARDALKPVGYINFRFELEANVEVVYCYEIQLESSVRRKGIGKFLLQILELIGHKTGMRKVMATVFKENTPSLDFFRTKMGYIEDNTSPNVCDPENADTCTYVILSKLLIKPRGINCPPEN